MAEAPEAPEADEREATTVAEARAGSKVAEAMAMGGVRVPETPDTGVRAVERGMVRLEEAAWVVLRVRAAPAA